MPIPADPFFEEWEADLSPEERAAFCRDGVADEDEWKAAPLRVLFVADAPDPKNDTAGAVDKLPYDLREMTREHGGGGSYGTPLARWAAMLVEGLTAKQAGALKRAELKRQVGRTARIALKKTGGDDDEEDVIAWALKHGERLMDQLDALDPQAIVLCGETACAAWPALLYDSADEKPVLRSQEFMWEDRAVLATLSPSAPGTKTADKDLDVARFAANPEVTKLRGAPVAPDEPEAPPEASGEEE